MYCYLHTSITSQINHNLYIECFFLVKTQINLLKLQIQSTECSTQNQTAKTQTIRQIQEFRYILRQQIKRMVWANMKFVGAVNTSQYLDAQQDVITAFISWTLHYRVQYGEAIYIVFDDGQSYRMEYKFSHYDHIWVFHKKFQDVNKHWYSYYVGKWNQNIWLRPITYMHSTVTIQKQFIPQQGYYSIDDWTHQTQ